MDRKDRGAALIIVLLMVTVLVAITLEMSRASRSEYTESANLRDRLKTLYLAKSGINLAESMLAEDDNLYDGLFEKWARPEIVSAQSAALFSDGYFSVAIEDESGRIPINRLSSDGSFYAPVRDALLNLLAQPEFGLDARKAAGIIAAIKDYIDADTGATPPEAVTATSAAPQNETGKEGGGREPAHFRNKPLDSLEELLAIKEVTPELFYGSKDRPGISRYLTVYGEGRININTAPKPVLKALSSNITDDLAAQMEDFRKSDRRDLAETGWYRKIPGLSGVNIQQDLITVRSRVFRITSTGNLDPAGKGADRIGSRAGVLSSTVTAVVERRDSASAGSGTPQNLPVQQTQNPPMRVLSWKID